MVQEKKERYSNFEFLRILCMLSIVLGHFTEQSGIAHHNTIFSAFFYTASDSMMRVACSVFVIISAYFLTEKEFKIRRIVHTWLALIFYTVTITLTLKFKRPDLVSKFDIYRAFLPVETTPLWFLNYYIVLLCCSPVLNAYIKNSNKRSLQWVLLGYIIFSSIYTTLSGRLDYFANDIWTFFFLYLATGFIKKYSINYSKWISFIIFSIFWLLLTLLRTYASLNPVSYYITRYLELYRAQLMTIPNIVMAFSIFYFFKNIKIKTSKVINTVARTTIGIYAFHQIPVFYPGLWKTIFHSSYYSVHRLGKFEYLYVLGVTVSVFCIGCILEIIRSKISNILIESKTWFKNICDSVDSDINCYNNNSEKTMAIGKVIICFVIYFLIFTIFLNTSMIQLP